MAQQDRNISRPCMDGHRNALIGEDPFEGLLATRRERRKQQAHKYTPLRERAANAEEVGDPFEGLLSLRRERRRIRKVPQDNKYTLHASQKQVKLKPKCRCRKQQGDAQLWSLVDDKLASAEHLGAQKLQRMYKATNLRGELQKRVLDKEETARIMSDEKAVVLQKVVRGKLARKLVEKDKLSGQYHKWKNHDEDKYTEKEKKFKEDKEAFVVYQMIENKVSKRLKQSSMADVVARVVEDMEIRRKQKQLSACIAERSSLASDEDSKDSPELLPEQPAEQEKLNLTEQWQERERQKQVRILLGVEGQGVRDAYSRGCALRCKESSWVKRRRPVVDLSSSSGRRRRTQGTPAGRGGGSGGDSGSGGGEKFEIVYLNRWSMEVRAVLAHLVLQSCGGCGKTFDTLLKEHPFYRNNRGKLNDQSVAELLCDTGGECASLYIPKKEVLYGLADEEEEVKTIGAGKVMDALQPKAGRGSKTNSNNSSTAGTSKSSTNTSRSCRYCCARCREERLFLSMVQKREFKRKLKPVLISPQDNFNFLHDYAAFVADPRPPPKPVNPSAGSMMQQWLTAKSEVHKQRKRGLMVR